MLDGGQLLDAALDFYQPVRDEEYDLESLEAGDLGDITLTPAPSMASSSWEKRKKYLDLAHTTTLGLLGGSAILGLLNVIVGQ